MKGLREALEDFSIDGLDLDLMTFGEYSILISDGLKCQDLIVKRAVELGFNQFLLTEEQRKAAVFCMSSEDLQAFKRPMEIVLKNKRLQRKLSKREKMIVEAHVRSTKVFANLDSIRSGKKKREILEGFSDEATGVFAYLYSWVMKRYDEPLFEGLFDFLPKNHLDSAMMDGYLWLVKNGLIKKRSGDEDGEI